MAPNVDAMGGKGGLDDKLMEIVATAEEKETPLVFALSMSVSKPACRRVIC